VLDVMSGEFIAMTTVSIANEYVFQIMNRHSYEQDTFIPLDTFIFPWLSESSKFMRELMVNQCHILSTIRKNAHCAFERLAALVNQLLSQVDMISM
jgi:hypothetical protein